MVGQPAERRGFTRIPFSTEVELQMDGRVIRSSERIDVSMSGLRVAAAATAKPGTLCSVKITLRASENSVLIEVSGKVIRSAAGTVAVEFAEIDLDSYQHLRQLILNNTEEPEKAEKEFIRNWGIRQRGSSGNGSTSGQGPAS